MEVKVIKKLNPTTNVEFLFEGKDLKEAILMATPILELQGTCGKCGSDNLTLRTRLVKDGEFEYLEFACQECRAKQGFGEYKKVKGAYFLKNEWEIYVKPEGK